MKNLIISLLITAYLLAYNSPAKAQNRWSVEVRPGINFLTRNTADTDLEIGYGIEGTASYLFIPHLATYAGWVWNRFSTDQSFAGSNVDFEETGYTFGLQSVRPLSSRINYLIRGGGLYNHIEVRNDTGGTIADSGYGLSWQIETGISFSSDKRLRITPSLRYRSLSRTIEIENVPTEVNLNYISAGIGISWSFLRKTNPD